MRAWREGRQPLQRCGIVRRDALYRSRHGWRARALGLLAEEPAHPAGRRRVGRPPPAARGLQRRQDARRRGRARPGDHGRGHDNRRRGDPRRGRPGRAPADARQARAFEPCARRARGGALGRHRPRRSRSRNAVLLPGRRLRASEGDHVPRERLAPPPALGLQARHPRPREAPRKRGRERKARPPRHPRRPRALGRRQRGVQQARLLSRVWHTHRLRARRQRTLSFEISSLISWRGEWYVVHLTGFK